MTRTSGLFDSFDNLDQISAEAVASWLRPVPQLITLENYVANRIFYPQTLPQTSYEQQIDLAILREALKMQVPLQHKTNALLGDNPFLNITLRKLLIPARFLDYVGDLADLAEVFIDALLASRKKEDFFADLWTVVLTDNNDETVGSIILPQFTGSSGMMHLTTFGKSYQISKGDFYSIPCPKDRCSISYKVSNGKVLGKSESAIEVAGGKLGLIVDGRST